MDFLDYILKIPGYIWGSWLIVLLVIIIGFIVRHKVKKLSIGDKPSKPLTAIIALVDFMNTYVKKNIGKHWRFVAPILLALAMYMFLLNISGLFLIDTPTKYTTVTVVFAIYSVLIVQITGIISRKWRHLGTLVGPIKWMSPIMIPLNIISDFTPLLSMTLRLFGSVASGAALMSLIYGMTSWASIIVAPAFHVIFDVGFGLIQTVVYVLLTVIFTSNKLDSKDFKQLI